MAMDRLLQAATQLQQTAEQRLGPAAAVVCDISDLADYLGPFSRNVQIVSTRIEGDTAIVVYQVGERVPVERAEVRRMAGRWRYMPDEPDYALPTLLLQLTDAMIHLHSQAESGTYREAGFHRGVRQAGPYPAAGPSAEVAASAEKRTRRRCALVGRWRVSDTDQLAFRPPGLGRTVFAGVRNHVPLRTGRNGRCP